ncbi:MAG: hypothetical protein KF897_13595 [Opitutaceae bacterium]|nr:hypothetical protein [Opitutaceae bacterium]
MRPWLKLCWRGTRFCAACVASFCLWTLWLALAILLAFQVYIASTRELAVPDFLLRSLEERLATSGVRAEFGRARFDPAGHVLLEQARLRLPALPDPVFTARSVFVTLDPWALLLGRFEPRKLEVEGANIHVAAMLSPTGRSEPLVQEVAFTLVPGHQHFALPHFAGRLAGMPLTARGDWQLPPRRDEAQRLPELLARNYPAICRQLIALADRLAVLESPVLDLTLTRSESQAAIAEIGLLAQGVRLESPQPITTGPVRLTTRVPLIGERPVPVSLAVATEAVRVGPAADLRRVQAVIHGRINPAQRAFAFERIELAAGTVTAAGLTAGPVALTAAGAWPVLQGELAGRVQDEAVSLAGTVDFAARSASLRAAGRFAPGLVDTVGQRLGRDLRRFIAFRSAPGFDLAVELAPGWKFTGLQGRVAGDGVDAYHVRMDAFSGHIAFDGRRFRATDALAWIGDNFARGSFEQDFTTREFRFLLTGRLHPPAIAGWFRGWWTNFWDDFDFTAAAPEADVDVRGRWGHGPETTVFVFADCTRPVVRGVALDHAIARLFIRPHHYDALEIFATQGGNAARGQFMRRTAPVGFALDHMEFDFDSTLPLPDAAQLVGPDLSQALRPIVLSAPPTVHARGRIDGPASARGTGRQIHVKGHATGAFTLHRFPLQHLDFEATLDGDRLLVAPVEVGFAGGTVTGSVQAWGPEEARRLGFALSLREGSVREAATALETYAARRRGVAPAANSAYIEGTAQVRMALDLEAEGAADDPYSFKGTGHASLGGQGLGRVRLLGLLSELLNFTALRFDALRTDFTLEGDTLNFPHVNLTGPDAAVTARGSYQLRRKELDFYARVFPFQESRFILKSVVGLVLTPLSGVLEVKLTGPLDKPQWAFVIGPTNFIRSILAPGKAAPVPDTTPPPAPSAPPATNP